MRIAFQLLGTDGWTGGYQYLLTLMSALSPLRDEGVECILYAGPDTSPAHLQPFLAHIEGNVRPRPPMRGRIGSGRDQVPRVVWQQDSLSERLYRQDGIDVVFQHAEWLGLRFRLPTIAWLGDFQHRRLPGMFTRRQYMLREARFRTVMHTATSLVVLSKDSRADCIRWYPEYLRKLAVLPFAVEVPTSAYERPVDDICLKYDLPRRYFYLPNQFWKHKNHPLVVSALMLIKSRGIRDIVVAVSGSPVDLRDPAYAPRLLETVEAAGLRTSFRVLGVVPRLDMWGLMRGSIAVINPSLYEGWSTSVEEAKSIGVPLILSDLPVHREQAAPGAVYFDPNDKEALADTLIQAQRDWPGGPHLDMEAAASNAIAARRTAFGRAALSIARATMSRSSTVQGS